jgi:GT2 family glycosyltransferase
MSIAISSRDRPDAFRRVVRMLAAQIPEERRPDLTLLVTFDGCDPYGLAELESLPIDVQVTHHEEARGFARGRNEAVELNRHRTIAFLDDDACPGPAWLATILRGLDRYPDALALGGRVCRLPSQDGLLPLLRDAIYYLETFGPWYLEPDDPSGPDLAGPPYVNGANSAYRAETFDRFGPFRPDLPACVDIEYGRRFGAREHAVLLAGMAIQHEHPDRFRSYLRRSVRAGQARRLMAPTFPPDAPAAFARERVRALLWTDLRRLAHLPDRRARGFAVLTIQELAQLYGYVRR